MDELFECARCKNAITPAVEFHELPLDYQRVRVRVCGDCFEFIVRSWLYAFGLRYMAENEAVTALRNLCHRVGQICLERAVTKNDLLERVFKKGDRRAIERIEKLFNEFLESHTSFFVQEREL